MGWDVFFGPKNDLAVKSLLCTHLAGPLHTLRTTPAVKHAVRNADSWISPTHQPLKTLLL